MSSSLCKTSVSRIYQEVIDDVITNVREQFLEDGVDEQVVQELRQLWETKLMATKAVQGEQEDKIVKKNDVINGNSLPKTQAIVVPQQQQQQQTVQAGTAASAASGNSTVAAATNTSGGTNEVKMVPIQLTLPPQPGTDGAQRVLTIQVPATALQGDQLRKVLTGPVITATMSLPPTIASSLLQQHVNAAFSSQQQASSGSTTKNVGQTDGINDDAEGEKCVDTELLVSVKRFDKGKKNKKSVSKSLNQTDGIRDTSDDDEAVSDDNDDDEELDDEKDECDPEMEDEGDEEEPLNSGDDVSDDDPSDLFDTDNIVVCQYDKIIRNRNKWKFYLKDGIMNLNGFDYVFQKATGDAEW